jgi:hypothetical protein
MNSGQILLAAWTLFRYSAIRLLSAGASFYLFALLARIFPHDVTANCYFFMFIFGFLVMAFRMAVNINANVARSRSRSGNLRSIQRAACQAFVVSLAIAPIAAWLLAPHMDSRWLLLAALPMLAFASVDTDMTRAMAGREPLFPAAFALGSIAAIFLLSFAPVQSHDTAIAALLMQWLPASILGATSLAHLGWKSLRKAMGNLRHEAWPLAWILLVALFDGLILNSPFFLGNKLEDAVRIDISVVIRIFSAALAFSPLVLHWSNSTTLGRLASSLGVTHIKAYLGLQITLSFIGAGAFIAAYTLISGAPIRLDQVVGVAVLLASHSLYAAASRHHGSNRPSSLEAVLSAIALLLFFLTMNWLLGHLGAVYCFMLQGGALLLGAAFLASQRKAKE